MRAVIMAGGKGTRLRPLTSHTPKPMVPLVNRPCMEYIIDLLKRHGITDIAVTVQYLPEVIKNHFGDGSRFGVRIEYFEEQTPLGTAGSVKHCEPFLTEPFVVISGDALTDIDLTRAIAFHREKGALATLVLSRVETPLEFGVVMTDDDGRVVRFLEKPGWSEVFSDTVNTGIYILEPEVLSYMDADTELDFSKDLFPFFLREGLPMYGYVADGYWSDIGSLAVYRQAHADILDGRVKVELKAQQIAPRIYLEPGVRIDSSVRIEGPAYIGEKTHLKAGSSIGAYTVLGSHVTVGSGAKVTQSILWENARVGQQAELTGTMLCRNVQTGESAWLGEGVVIGDCSRIGAKSMIKAGVKIWPQKVVEENATVHTSLIYGERQGKQLFGSRGIKGMGNVDITPEFVTRLAAAYAYLLPDGARIALSACAHPYTQLLKHSMLTSLCCAGIDTVDFGVSIAPVTRYGVRSFRCHGGIHLYMREGTDEGEVVLEFYDQYGLPITRDVERKVENAFWQETFVRSATDRLGHLSVEHSVRHAYQQAMWDEIDINLLRNRRFQLLIDCEQRFLPAFLTELFREAGVSAQFGPIGDGVSRRGVDVAFRLDKSGEQFFLYTETGERLSAEKTLALQLVAAFPNGAGRTVGLPVSAPEELEELARELKLNVVRTKVTPRAMMEVAPDTRFHPLFDAVYSMFAILAYMAVREQPLSKLAQSLPACHMERRTVYCPWNTKGKVMRRVMEEVKGKQLELVDGVKVYDEAGWVLILPDSEDASVAVISQGVTQETAATLASSFARRIAEYQETP